MTDLIKSITAQTFIKDMIGAIALLAMLYVGLWMPAFL